MSAQTRVASSRWSYHFCIPLLVAFLAGQALLWAAPPISEDGGGPVDTDRSSSKQIDRPDPKEVARIKERLQWQRAQRQQRLAGGGSPTLNGESQFLQKTGTDKVLVILVEFDGTNNFTWTPGVSTWDPLGRCDNSEFDGANLANSAASSFFAQKYGITAPTNFTYIGPLHNVLPRPLGTNDPSATTIWTPDFSASYYSNIIFGGGFVFDYTRQDGSVVHEDYTGKSVRDYYEDLSGGVYTITGTILGWVRVTNSVWYYGGDGLPGARSCSLRPAFSGAIPGGGDNRNLVIDALNSAKAAYPGFDWASFDQDQDGVIDRLWIIHAGYGEEDNPGLLNRTTYGEGGMWSHSSALGTPYQVVPGVYANAYIMMPENAGIAVLAHEFGHNLGAMDLYTYGDGQTSAGFWTLMSDSWVGFPLGFLPEAMDPMQLDNWGWLEPLIVSDATKVHVATLGQASEFPGTSNLVRAVKIELPDGPVPLPVQPHGQFQWWGGQEVLADTRMTLRQALHIPPAGGTLEFQTTYDTEANYDFFRVEVSSNGGASWSQLASYSGSSASFPSYQGRSLSLAAYANQDILLRFRYTTDEYILGAGPFVDDIVVNSGTQILLTDDAEVERDLWTFTAPWVRNNGTAGYSHNFYLQWRNTSLSGGYDQALGDTRFRFGPANTGLLVWYQDDRYDENSIGSHLTDSPSFGPKGKLLVVDAHPEPYLDPYWVALGVTNERGNVFSRGLMRDAPFSRWPAVSFNLAPPFAFEPASFEGRPPVHWFSDATGYYPGIQSLAPNAWRTSQWDASVVMPSSVAYGVRGPGYPAGTPLDQVIATRSFIGTTELLTYRTNAIVGGLALPGGDGDPGSVGGDYGWNVWIVHQTNAFAQVVIWNSHFAHLDDDLDGVPNWQEAIAGTDSNNKNSFLRITRASVDRQDGSFFIEWTSVSNRVYRVWRSVDLSSGFPTVVAEDLPATPPLSSFLDHSPSVSSTVFYRVEVQ